MSWGQEICQIVQEQLTIACSTKHCAQVHWGPTIKTMPGGLDSWDNRPRWTDKHGGQTNMVGGEEDDKHGGPGAPQYLTDPVQPGVFYKQARKSLSDGLWKYIQGTVNPKPEELES